MSDPRKIAAQVFNEKSSTAEFGLGSVPYHTHNGTDSAKTRFISQTDTPVSYSGNAGKAVVVNSTASGLIFSSATSTYGGYINGNATAGTPFPTGWTVARSSGQPTGDYTVTHNLGNAAYSVVLTGAGASLEIVEIFSISSNTFRYQTYSSVASIKDADVTFILVKP